MDVCTTTITCRTLRLNYIFSRELASIEHPPSLQIISIDYSIFLPIRNILLSISPQILDFPSIYPAALLSVSTNYPSYIFPSHLPSIHSFNHLLGFLAAQRSIKEHGVSRPYIGNECEDVLDFNGEEGLKGVEWMSA